MSKSASGPSLGSVRLRDVEPADVPTLFENECDPDAVRMAAVYQRDAETFAAHWAKVLADPSVRAGAILVDGTLVGYVSCFKMDGLDSVGYWIAKPYWGRGVATRALALLLQQVAVRPLHARVARHNLASIRVLQRSGFVVTGYQTSHDVERFPACEEAILVLS